MRSALSIACELGGFSERSVGAVASISWNDFDERRQISRWPFIGTADTVANRIVKELDVRYEFEQCLIKRNSLLLGWLRGAFAGDG